MAQWEKFKHRKKERKQIDKRNNIKQMVDNI